jgi:prophage antirepressor-like protein
MNAVATQSFGFGELLVRVVDRDDGVWFVANDVCRALELMNSRKAIAVLDEDEKGVTTSYTLGGPQEMAIISESGLYALIFRSRKPVAVRFRRWVTQEVLPAIRRNGSYEVPANDETTEAVPAEQLDTGEHWRTGLQLVREARILGGRIAGRRAWICAGLPDVFSEPERPVLLLTQSGISADAQTVSEWVAEKCELLPGVRTRSMDLFANFEAWCAETGRECRGLVSFGRMLSALGFAKVKSDAMYRVGLRVRS